MTEYEIVWDGAVRQQVVTVEVTMEDLRTFRVQRVMACQDALLPPRATNTEYRDREAPESEATRQRRQQRPRLSNAEREQIVGLHFAGWTGRAIARRMKLAQSTVQAFLWRQQAKRRSKQAGQ